MSFLNEFKKFAIKGNAVDLAVGVVIGAAFGGIVNSLVEDIIMPPISVLTGEIDFSDKVVILKQGADEATTIALRYGEFLNNILDFLIVALAVFLMIRQINKWNKQEIPPEPTEKECPYCSRKIPLKASRCPECTSELTTATSGV